MKKITALVLSLWLFLSLPLCAAAAEQLPPAALAVEESLASPPPETSENPEEPAEAEEETEETAEEPAPKAEEPAAPEPPDALSALLGKNPIAYEVDLAAYYLEEMRAAAVAGNVKAGHTAEENRAAAIDAGGRGEKIAFDDLYLLARIIDSAAGSDWLTDEFRMCVGEVVLNRVASPEFPDSIQGVVYQKGQYSVVNTARFATLAPREECVDAALRLLQGERHMVPGVVYQADYLQGELFSVYFDRRLGNTYFCLSENLDLYP